MSMPITTDDLLQSNLDLTMKQVLLSYKTGRVTVADVPIPACKSGGVLVANVCSVVSAGTERASIQLGKGSLLEKARQRPEQVRQVLHTLGQEGPAATIKKVLTRLDTWVPLGYCSAGIAARVGSHVSHLREGDPVVCAGEGIGSHAEVVWAPRLLCHRIPEGLSFEEAAFAPLGAIALQAVRQAQISIGERVVVIGLGLLGLLAVQLLRAAGCHVFGIDIDVQRCGLARTLGATSTASLHEPSLSDQVREFSRGYGVDAVLVMASTDSSEPLLQAGAYCREKGRVVVAGAVPLEFPRKDYWEKELSLSMSRSFGPGYYDPQYAVHGVDYPIGYVRWSTGRNIQEVLTLLVERRLSVEPLVSRRFEIEQAEAAYEGLAQQSSDVLGVAFQYPGSLEKARRRPSQAPLHSSPKHEEIRLGWIGAGNFAQAYLIPAFREHSQVILDVVVNSTAVSTHNTRAKFGFLQSACDKATALASPTVNCIVVSTRHNLHAELAVAALNHGKSVFLEKPMALTVDELRHVCSAARASRGGILVGFNRRYSPTVRWLLRHFKREAGPVMIQYRVNAGAVPGGHWVRDQVHGGGRIVGEVCHFVDLCHFLAGSPPVSVFARTLPGLPGLGSEDDNVQVTIEHANGALAQISYTAVGDPAFPRERVEVIGQEAVGVIDNFQFAEVSRQGRRHRKRLWARDMGYKAEVEGFVKALLSGAPMPTSYEESALSTLATLRIIDSLRTGVPVRVDRQDLYEEAV